MPQATLPSPQQLQDRAPTLSLLASLICGWLLSHMPTTPPSPFGTLLQCQVCLPLPCTPSLSDLCLTQVPSLLGSLPGPPRVKYHCTLYALPAKHLPDCRVRESIHSRTAPTFTSTSKLRKERDRIPPILRCLALGQSRSSKHWLVEYINTNTQEHMIVSS